MNECVLQLNFHPRLLGPFEGGERGRDARIRKAGMCHDIYTRTCPYSKSWQSKPFYKWLEILSSFDIKKQEKERLISIPKWSPNWKVQLSWCRQRKRPDERCWKTLLLPHTFSRRIYFVKCNIGRPLIGKRPHQWLSFFACWPVRMFIEWRENKFEGLVTLEDHGRASKCCNVVSVINESPWLHSPPAL